MFIRSAVRTCSLLLVVALPTTLWAGDGGSKTSSGAVCTIGGTNQPYVTLSLYGAENIHTTADMSVFCPILRDDLLEDDLNDFTVWVEDNDDADSVDCRLYTRDPSEDSLYSGSLASSNVGGTGRYELNPSIPAVTLGGDAIYGMYCTLPDLDMGASSVVAFRWEE